VAVVEEEAALLPQHPQNRALKGSGDSSGRVRSVDVLKMR
jgi:hypothetical protein